MKHLIFIVAYNHENFIDKVLERLPSTIFKEDYEILIIDDASIDKTFDTATKWKNNNKDININILKNSKNYGYGGNQKIGMQYAIKNNFDTLILLHGDGQYAPELIHDLIKYHIKNNSSLTLGSRMINKRNALKGKMPLYKFIGNIILTKFQNILLNTNLSEFHTGYRVYSIKSLKNIKFHLNTNDFHFDTEIIIQNIANKYKISEFSIPTYYGKEISYVNGLSYAYNVLKESVLYKLQSLGIFYSEKYNYKIEYYEDKSHFLSSHLIAINEVTKNSSIIDIGSSNAKYLKRLKEEKNCYIKTVNQYSNLKNSIVDEEEIVDLNVELPNNINKFKFIFLLDIVEHLRDPELFVKNLHLKTNNNQIVIASTANVAFIVVRLMLFFGFFNYGNRGILDKTHTRLFTFNSFKKLFENDYEIIKIKGIPAPIPLAIGNNFISKLLINLNSVLIKISKPIFSYQILLVMKPKASLKSILEETEKFSKEIHDS